jgi:hypothetical protein
VCKRSRLRECEREYEKEVHSDKECENEVDSGRECEREVDLENGREK